MWFPPSWFFLVFGIGLLIFDFYLMYKIKSPDFRHDVIIISICCFGICLSYIFSNENWINVYIRWITSIALAVLCGSDIGYIISKYKHSIGIPLLYNCISVVICISIFSMMIFK